MKWTEVSEDTRDWLTRLGNFRPTVSVRDRELKGHLIDEGQTYFKSEDLRGISAALVEAADWLDKRADSDAPTVYANT
jgi:hypothetical protein